MSTPPAASPRSAFPDLYHGKPHWPTKDDRHLFWVGIRSDFKFSHGPAGKVNGDENGAEDASTDFFCAPEGLEEKLLGLLVDSWRGSVLVTGYRGTGKTSLVGRCHRRLEERLKDATMPDEPEPWWIKINLATVASGREVLLLTYGALIAKLEEKAEEEKTAAKKDWDLQMAEATRAYEDCRPERYAVNRWRREKVRSWYRQADKQPRWYRLGWAASFWPLKAVLQKLRDEAAKHLDDLKKRNPTEGNLPNDGDPQKAENVRRYLSASLRKLGATQFSVSESPGSGLPGLSDAILASASPGAQSEFTMDRDALSQAQSDLTDALSKLRTLKFRGPDGWRHPRIVFVYDELDKLQPTDDPADEPSRQRSLLSPAEKLAQLQTIVAELKYFLTESDSHQIFIAGKDADDSWSEDQSKGEGLFESIFIGNIYVPSIFSTELVPCVGGPSIAKAERKDFYEVLARELGIPHNSWAFNTALLVLPHLAEVEIYQLMLRAYRRRLESPNFPNENLVAPRRWLYFCAKRGAGSEKRPCQGHVFDTKQDRHWSPPPGLTDNRPSDPEEPSEAWLHTQVVLERTILKTEVPDWITHVTSERACRRLRILIEYLTYKGRGIPRKILREFYELIQPSSQVVPKDDPGYFRIYDSAKGKLAVPYVLAFEQHLLQKMNFYASIVAYLDMSFAELRGLHDKGRVSIYHIIDYVLKFYVTGFFQRDIEHANFMTTREELYPTRQLAALILRVLEGRLWRRKASRNPEYRMLHHVVHDLSVMFLRYAPEQLELRHTRADFKNEFEHLGKMLASVDKSATEERLTPVHAQLRLARILDLTGSHFEARLAYFKALRWLRMDIRHFETDARVDRRHETSARGGSAQWIGDGFVPHFGGYVIEALLAVGRLHEELSEYGNAIRHYNEAERLQHRLKGWPDGGDHYGWISAAPTATGASGPSAGPTLLADLAEAMLATLIPADAKLQDGRDHHRGEFARVLAERDKVRPINVSNQADRYTDVCNHSAVAYAKMWENAAANLALLRGLVHLNNIHDEYGLIDQLFFIGQMMVRRRDFHAAALWYVEALQRIAAIRRYAKSSAVQSGAEWQTPTALTSTEALILAALGDVCYATDGLALLGLCSPDGQKQFLADRLKRLGETKFSALKALAADQLTAVIHQLDLGIYEDRAEEYFHTCARLRFQSIGDHINSTDVYLRQLEIRLDQFQRALSRLDTFRDAIVATPELTDLKYTVLNSWSGFWQAARVLMHANLSPVTALTRDLKYEWGRITDFRRMGVLMRLVGEMLRETALHPFSRTLITRQTLGNNVATGRVTTRGYRICPFCRKFLGLPDVAASGSLRQASRLLWQPLRADEVASQVYQRWTRLNPKWQPQILREASLDIRRGDDRAWASDQPEHQKKWSKDVFRGRVSVNRAVRDIRTVVSFIRDHHELLFDSYASEEKKRTKYKNDGKSDAEVAAILDEPNRLGGPHYRSLLFRMNASGPDSGVANECGVLPLAALHDIFRSIAPTAEAGAFVRDLRLMALSEEALLTSYLCYRDTIPDFGYAQTALAVGDLYITALYRIGRNLRAVIGPNPIPDEKRGELAKAIDSITNFAKRYIAKAIDVLKREREHNRNTFHLLSEAYFNLGDLMLLRLAWIKSERRDANSDNGLNLLYDSQLFGSVAFEDIPKKTDSATAKKPDNPYGDIEPEDVRRQSAEAYRDGLVLVQSEMDEHATRFRFPPDVYYTHRNIMDAVLHFRICRAARVRHGGGRFAANAGDPSVEFDANKLQQAWEEISLRLGHFESPQRFSPYWVRTFRGLLNTVNAVRTDRGPLEAPEKDGKAEKLSWREADNINSRTVPGDQRPVTDELFNMYNHTTSDFWKAL